MNIFKLVIEIAADKAGDKISVIDYDTTCL